MISECNKLTLTLIALISVEIWHLQFQSFVTCTVGKFYVTGFMLHCMNSSFRWSTSSSVPIVAISSITINGLHSSFQHRSFYHQWLRFWWNSLHLSDSQLGVSNDQNGRFGPLRVNHCPHIQLFHHFRDREFIKSEYKHLWTNIPKWKWIRSE